MTTQKSNKPKKKILPLGLYPDQRAIIQKIASADPDARGRMRQVILIKVLGRAEALRDPSFKRSP